MMTETHCDDGNTLRERERERERILKENVTRNYYKKRLPSIL
jgi:hypothetical protein